MPTLETFRRRLGWYWRLRAVNGRITAIGAEPFARRGNAVRSFKIMQKKAVKIG